MTENRSRIWLIIACFLVINSLNKSLHAQNSIDSITVGMFKNGHLLYQDNFDTGMSNWVVETPDSPYSNVGIVDSTLVIDVDHGATIWFKKKLSGNILIECKREVIMKDGHNDRLSDLNQFWMAADPDQENLFTRSGTFAEYHNLRLYYAGIGGNYNTTTRFRKYPGTGERTLLFDLQDENHLLKANKTYLIQIIVYKNVTRVLVDGQIYFSYTDNQPLREGYFGFRTVKSHQQIDDFKVYGLK